MKTKYIKTADFDQYIKRNNLRVVSSAGPNASITGMKKLYWGKDAQVIKSGNYIYKVESF